MRLLNCQLQNVRLHGDLDLTFSPRLTLIGGPNESGKSTLVEALHRALFLKASATGAPVEALQSRLHLGQPVVQIGFEAKGDNWTLRKRFSGATGQVTLQAESSGKPLTGPAAEDVLAELLGVGEIIGSRQAGTVLPSRWAHLWVRQGLSGDDLLATSTSHYDFDQLRMQLERSGGAAVQQSALDQQVEKRIKEALDENFTTRGTKRHSPLYGREEALKTAQSRMELALARLAEYEDASEQLADLCDELEQLQAQQLPALLESQKRQQEGAQAVNRLDAAIELATKELEPIQLRHGAAQQTLQQLDDLHAEIAQRQTLLTTLEANATGAQGREAELKAAELQHKQSLATLNQQRQSLEQRQQVLQRLVERTSTAESLTRQNAEVEKLQQEASKRQSLQRQLNDLPAISKPSLLDLRGLEQQLRDALTRQEAMAAGVKLLKADQPVRLDGRPLQVGDEQRLSAVFQLQVGDGVVMEIAPGGGQALGDLEQTVQDTRNQLVTQLAALKVDTVVAAEALLEQRNALDQQLAALGAALADPGKLKQQNSALQQRLAELDGELQDLAEVRQAMEQEQPLPESLSGLQALQQQVSATSKHTLAAVGAADKELEAARSALQAFQQQRISEASQIEVVRGELADRRQRLEPLISQHGDRDGMAAQLTGLGKQRQEAEAELNRLKAERTAISSQDPEREQQRLQEQMENLTRRQEELLDQRGAAKQRCDSISSQDPFAAVEQARLQLETAEADLRQLQRVIAAHKLLRDTFQDVQADVSSRYSEPLARAIGDYLRPLVPDGQVARLSYDQSKGFQGLQLRRGQEYYDFEALSGGMREQLAAALRLSMADVLKEAHDGCLPLVFDDAFTNSDPERIDLVKRMLGTAVDRGLQVILLTCDPTAYGAFADAVVELGSG
jgi:DNA repair exonuclease SbcCD ATPase subunit